MNEGTDRVYLAPRKKNFEHEEDQRGRTKEGRQRTTATQSILPLLHSCPGGVRKSAIHSP